MLKKDQTLFEVSLLSGVDFATFYKIVRVKDGLILLFGRGLLKIWHKECKL